MVRRIALQLARTVPANVELDDLVQVGMIALHDSMGRYVDDGRARFESYASTRVRGAMLDELRRADPLTRKARREERAGGASTHVVSFEDLGADDVDVLELLPADESVDPINQLKDLRMRQALVTAIEDLPERDRNVMSMYYEHDMKLREIGAVMGLTESRMCQVLRDILVGLRERLSDH